MPTLTPSGLGAAVSTTAKAVLAALVVTHILPWDDATTTTVALAIAAVVDLAVILGLIRPRVTPVTPDAPTEPTD